MNENGNENTIDETLENLLNKSPRLLLEVGLKPVQSYRFQPTGFPDLGAAEYQAPDGTNMLLVESPQSMANRMEAVCWDEEKGDLVEPLKGLPYIKVNFLNGVIPNGTTTSSIKEAHRIASEYIAENPNFIGNIKEEIGYDEKKPIDNLSFYKTLLKYDPNSLIHGVFLANLDGRLRLPRALSGFIEASRIKSVQSGGVKFNHVKPTSGEEKGRGTLPYPRTEYTAENVVAYFNLDLSAIKSYYFADNKENEAKNAEIYVKKLLIALSLYKIRKFLQEGLKLRTACEFEHIGEIKSNIKEFKLPTLLELEPTIKELIEKCRNEKFFADPAITEISFDIEKSTNDNGGEGKGGENGKQSEEKEKSMDEN